jgi:hypothetical protein
MPVLTWLRADTINGALMEATLPVVMSKICRKFGLRFSEAVKEVMTNPHSVCVSDVSLPDDNFIVNTQFQTSRHKFVKLHFN